MSEANSALALPCPRCGFDCRVSSASACPECGHDFEATRPWTLRLCDAQAEQWLLIRLSWLLSVAVNTFELLAGVALGGRLLAYLPLLFFAAISLLAVILGAVIPALIAWKSLERSKAWPVMLLGGSVVGMKFLSLWMQRDPMIGSAVITQSLLRALSLIFNQGLGLILLWHVLEIARGQVGGPLGVRAIVARALRWSFIAHAVALGLTLAWIPREAIGAARLGDAMELAFTIAMVVSRTFGLFGLAAELLALRLLASSSARNRQWSGAILSVLIFAVIFEALFWPALTVLKAGSAGGTAQAALMGWYEFVTWYWVAVVTAQCVGTGAVWRRVRALERCESASASTREVSRANG